MQPDGVSELTYTLVSLDKEYGIESSDIRWEDFYAERLLESSGPRSTFLP